MISPIAIESPYIAGLPSEVEVRAGAETVVELRSAAGAGYVWEVIPMDGSSAIAELRIEVEPVPRQTEPPSNQPAAVMLKITGQEPGQARWRLRLVRPWGERETLVEHELKITVSH